MTTTNAAETIAEAIKNWDCKDVNALRDLVIALKGCCDDPQAYADMTALPSAAIPADIDLGYPVWAADVRGNALVGDGATIIETFDEIRGIA